MRQAGPLYGRDDERRQMDAALDAVAAGGRRTVLVVGEAGIGKTGLVADRAAAARADGFLVAVGRCAPVAAVDLPYGPILDLLTDLLGRVPDLVSRLPAPARRAVDALLDADGATLTETAATRIFASFVALLGVAAGDRPVLLVAEDVHWADPASADLLSYAARAGPEGLALVCTARDDRDALDPGVRSALNEIRRLPDAVEIPLGPLDDAAIDRLLADGPAPQMPPELADRIRRLCGGNPFYAEQLAARGTVGDIPPRLRELVAASVDRLTPAARQLVGQLSIMGPSPAALLLDASAVDPLAADASLRELTSKNLITLSPGETGATTVRFRHDLVGEIVAGLALPTERAAGHARAAQALLRYASRPGPVGPATAATLAHHLQAAGRPAQALPHAIAAGRRAFAVRAFGSAHRSYRQALACWAAVDDPVNATGLSTATVVLEAAESCRWAGDPQASLQLLDRGWAASDLRATDRAAIAHSRGQAHWAIGELDAATVDHRQAVALLPPDAPAELRVELLAALAQALMTAGRATEALAATSAALAVPRPAAPGVADAETGPIQPAARTGADARFTRATVNARITAAAARAQLGDVDLAVAQLRDCLPMALALDDIEVVTRCFGNLTFALGRAGQPSEVIEAAAEGERVCRRYGPVLTLASTMINNEVAALTQLGRWDEAVACATRALREVTAPSMRRHLRVSLLIIAVARGAGAEIDDELAELTASATSDPYALAALSVLRAQRSCGAEDPDAGAVHIVDALTILAAQEDDITLLDACFWGLRCEAERARNRIPAEPDAIGAERCARLLDLVHRAAGRSPGSPVAASVALCEAEARRVTGDDDAADWESALDLLGDAGSAVMIAYCRLRLAGAQLRRQARTAAGRSLSEGLRIAESLGAAPLVDQFEAVARAADLPLTTQATAHRAGQADGLGLTPRERQVLALVATGATNRAIGRRLHISERTAGVHVANILGKLRVTNRTEAAHLAVRWNLDKSPG